MSLFECTQLPPMSLFVTNFGYSPPPYPEDVIFLMAPNVTWKLTLNLICIQLFWVIDHIFAIDIFVMDNFYSL